METGEVITFEGVYGADNSQAASLIAYTFVSKELPPIYLQSAYLTPETCIVMHQSALFRITISTQMRSSPQLSRQISFPPVTALAVLLLTFPAGRAALPILLL